MCPVLSFYTGNNYALLIQTCFHFRYELVTTYSDTCVIHFPNSEYNHFNGFKIIVIIIFNPKEKFIICCLPIYLHGFCGKRLCKSCMMNGEAFLPTIDILLAGTCPSLSVTYCTMNGTIKPHSHWDIVKPEQHC